MHPQGFKATARQPLSKSEVKKHYVLTEHVHINEGECTRSSNSVLGIFKNITSALDYAQAYCDGKTLKWVWSDDRFVCSLIGVENGNITNTNLIIQSVPFYEEV